jgi:ATP-dependent Clp protease ATP-binding subunit ClpA
MLKELLVGRARQAVPIYRQFEAEARADGARFIEAEHVLLALAASDTEAGKLLVEAGLDRERLAAALRDERRQSLAYAGIRNSAETPAATMESDRPVALGTSAKAALGRAMQARHQEPARRRLDGFDFLVGILTAELGTVPRALALAGVDRKALITRARSREGSQRAC